MKGVVLAAGEGIRLRPLTDDTPKPLLESGPHHLIHYPLKALRAAAISEIAVVVGHQAEKMHNVLLAAYPHLSIIHNQQYDGGNALSVLAAREYVSDEPFVVCMADHPISPEITRFLLSKKRVPSVLCVDRKARHSSQTNDATRVLVDSNGFVSAIGKRLNSWNAVDTGVFMLTPNVFQAIEHLITRRGIDVTMSNLVEYMGFSGRPFATCDVSGMFWADVDTIEDYRSVVTLLGERYEERV